MMDRLLSIPDGWLVALWGVGWTAAFLVPEPASCLGAVFAGACGGVGLVRALGIRGGR